MNDKNEMGLNLTTVTGASGFSSFFKDGATAYSTGPAQFYVGLYRGGLDAAARLLREQADYLAALSRIEQPSEALAVHGEFARKALANWSEEGKRIFEQGIAGVAPGK